MLEKRRIINLICTPQLVSGKLPPLTFAFPLKDKKNEACNAVNSHRNIFFSLSELSYSSSRYREKELRFCFFVFFLHQVAEVPYLFSYKFADGDRPGHA